MFSRVRNLRCGRQPPYEAIPDFAKNMSSTLLAKMAPNFAQLARSLLCPLPLLETLRLLPVPHQCNKPNSSEAYPPRVAIVHNFQMRGRSLSSQLPEERPLSATFP